MNGNVRGSQSLCDLMESNKGLRGSQSLCDLMESNKGFPRGRGPRGGDRGNWGRGRGQARGRGRGRGRGQNATPTFQQPPPSYNEAMMESSFRNASVSSKVFPSQTFYQGQPYVGGGPAFHGQMAYNKCVPSAPRQPLLPIPYHCQGAPHDMAEDLHCLVNELTKFSKFCGSIDDICRSMSRDYNYIRKICSDKTEIFSIVDDKTAMKTSIKLTPSLRICEDYGKSVCRNTCCLYIHICLDYIFGTCTQVDTRCNFGHKWDTNHNLVVLKNFYLNKVDDAILNELVQQMFGNSRQPKVCSDYQQQCCQNGTQCNDVHICYSFVKTLGNCPSGKSCLFNHEIFDPQCLSVFQRFRISTNDSPRDLVKIILLEESKGGFSLGNI